MTIPIRLREPKVEMKHKPHIMDVSIFEYLKNSENVIESFHGKYPFFWEIRK